ncbi:MAG: carboxypeptidase regulatory-like domain-containing protein, partial [Planctomycetes bacterium]|nr:carboxypeptidase regulatory-like domain-containing protein [Planctomycetota bacterium]
MRNRTEEAGAVCVRPLRSIIPSLALLFVVALAGSVLKVPAVAAVGDGSAQTLRVTVMDAAGNLLPGAMVAAIDAEGLNVKATERPDGVYVIEGVWAKTTLEVDHPSFVPGSFELTLPDQRMVQVEVILGKANPVAVIIEADKRLAPGGGGPGKADLSAQGIVAAAAGVCPGEGDCCEANGTPGCNDLDCCQIVCAVDPFCCDFFWDSICAGQAQVLCPKLCFVPPPPNDNCADAIPIDNGDTPYTTIGATDDAPPLPPGCDEGFGLGFGSEIWFNYNSSFTGLLTVSTCDQVDYDSRLAAYTGGCANLTLVACND